MENKFVTLATVVSLLFFSYTFPTFAQEVSSTPIPYDLPYPGILLGQLLYPLKEAKESLFSFFIADSQEKAQFFLEQAEKYINASYLLFFVEPYNQEYFTATLNKAAMYSEGAFTSAKGSTKEGKDGHLVIEKLTLPLEKQEELLTTMDETADKEQKKLLKDYNQKLLQLQKEIRIYQMEAK